MLLRQMPVHPCDVAGTCGCDTSVVDADSGQSPALGSPLAHAVSAVCRSDSSTRVRTRFTGCLVMVTGATVSTSLLLYTAVGDWPWKRRCRSSMQLLRTAASLHCPGVSSVGCGCPCRDVACSPVIRLMLLGSTGVSLRAHRAVTRLLVSGRGCGCVRSLCSCR